MPYSIRLTWGTSEASGAESRCQRINFGTYKPSPGIKEYNKKRIIQFGPLVLELLNHNEIKVIFIDIDCSVIVTRWYVPLEANK